MNELHKTEASVIGSILTNWVEHVNCFGIIQNYHFNDYIHQCIFKGLESLNSKNKPIDSITVTNELKVMGLLEAIGGSYTLEKYKDYNIFSSIEIHCYLILEAYLKREVEKFGMIIQNRVKDVGQDVFEVIAEAEKTLSELVKGIVTKNIEGIEVVKNEVILEMYEVLKSGKKSGILTSIHDLNAHTSGWQKQNLIILAGRPGMGKTAAALDFALTPALNGQSVAFFSLEMSKEELTGRALSIISHVNVQKITNKNLTEQEIIYIEKQGQSLNNVPLFIDDSPSLSIFSLRNKARKLKREKGIELIIIDYLQLMTVKSNSKSGNREQEISEISRGLKALAKELDIPIIALAQLSRAVELRPDKKPLLSDLRESGAIEQDADMIIFPFRPEYYGMKDYLWGNETIGSDQLLIWIIGKFRNGSTGEIKSKFIGDNTMVVNYLA